MSPEHELFRRELGGRLLLKAILAGSLSACHPSPKAEPPSDDEAYQLITAPNPTFDENGIEIFNSERFEILMAEAGFTIDTSASNMPRYSAEFNGVKWSINVFNRDMHGKIRIVYHLEKDANESGGVKYVNGDTIADVIKRLTFALSN